LRKWRKFSQWVVPVAPMYSEEGLCQHTILQLRNSIDEAIALDNTPSLNLFAIVSQGSADQCLVAHAISSTMTTINAINTSTSSQIHCTMPVLAHSPSQSSIKHPLLTLSPDEMANSLLFLQVKELSISITTTPPLPALVTHRSAKRSHTLVTQNGSVGWVLWWVTKHDRYYTSSGRFFHLSSQQ